jgi:hypothetical protein
MKSIKKILNRWDWYITQKKKKNIKHNSQNNSILKAIKKYKTQYY